MTTTLDFRSATWFPMWSTPRISHSNQWGAEWNRILMRNPGHLNIPLIQLSWGPEWKICPAIYNKYRDLPLGRVTTLTRADLLVVTRLSDTYTERLNRNCNSNAENSKSSYFWVTGSLKGDPGIFVDILSQEPPSKENIILPLFCLVSDSRSSRSCIYTSS